MISLYYFGILFPPARRQHSSPASQAGALKAGSEAGGRRPCGPGPKAWGPAPRAMPLDTVSPAAAASPGEPGVNRVAAASRPAGLQAGRRPPHFPLCCRLKPGSPSPPWEAGARRAGPPATGPCGCHPSPRAPVEGPPPWESVFFGFLDINCSFIINVISSNINLTNIRS